MKLYLIFTKRGLAVILALTVLALIFIGQFSTVSQGYIDGKTHQKRMEFFKCVNLSVDENALSVKESFIPNKLTGAAKEYNFIQQKCGFNLENFRGKAVTIYTYSLIENPYRRVSVLVCDGKIIAGDITDVLSGKISPIIKEK